MRYYFYTNVSSLETISSTICITPRVTKGMIYAKRASQRTFTDNNDEATRKVLLNNKNGETKIS